MHDGDTLFIKDQETFKEMYGGYGTLLKKRRDKAGSVLHGGILRCLDRGMVVKIRRGGSVLGMFGGCPPRHALWSKVTSYNERGAMFAKGLEVVVVGVGS